MPEYQAIENKLKAQLTKVVAGRKLLLGIYDPENLNELGEPELLAVAGQQGLTLNREGDTIDTTSKSGGGWMEQIKGLKEWSIDMDGIYVTEDTSHDRLIELYNSDDGLVLIAIYNAETKEIVAAGIALLNSYPLEAPYDDVTTYSASFSGTGQLLSKKEIDDINNNVEETGDEA